MAALYPGHQLPGALQKEEEEEVYEFTMLSVWVITDIHLGDLINFEETFYKRYAIKGHAILLFEFRAPSINNTVNARICEDVITL